MVTTHTIEVMSPLHAIPAHNVGWHTFFVSVFWGGEESVWFGFLRGSFLVKWRGLCLQNSTDNLVPGII